jgi:hypothetical protein
LFIEGSGAREAANELRDLPGLTVDLAERHADQQHKDLVVLAVVATVVALADSAFNVAERIIRWRRKQKETSPVTIERVIIVRGDLRLPLDRLDPTGLADLLSPEADQPGADRPGPDPG